MDLDVTRISLTHLELCVEDMQKAATLEELDEIVDQARQALEGVYNSCKVKFEDWNEV